jgi:hypothetical protein
MLERWAHGRTKSIQEHAALAGATPRDRVELMVQIYAGPINAEGSAGPRFFCFLLPSGRTGNEERKRMSRQQQINLLKRLLNYVETRTTSMAEGATAPLRHSALGLGTHLQDCLKMLQHRDDPVAVRTDLGTDGKMLDNLKSRPGVDLISAFNSCTWFSGDL